MLMCRNVTKWVVCQNINNGEMSRMSEYQQRQKMAWVIQAENITLPVFSTTIFGMLGVSWQLYYCIFCTKGVFFSHLARP